MILCITKWPSFCGLSHKLYYLHYSQLIFLNQNNGSQPFFNSGPQLALLKCVWFKNFPKLNNCVYNVWKILNIAIQELNHPPNSSKCYNMALWFSSHYILTVLVNWIQNKRIFKNIFKTNILNLNKDVYKKVNNFSKREFNEGMILCQEKDSPANDDQEVFHE